MDFNDFSDTDKFNVYRLLQKLKEGRDLDKKVRHSSFLKDQNAVEFYE